MLIHYLLSFFPFSFTFSPSHPPVPHLPSFFTPFLPFSLCFHPYSLLFMPLFLVWSFLFMIPLRFSVSEERLMITSCLSVYLSRLSVEKIVRSCEVSVLPTGSGHVNYLIYPSNVAQRTPVELLCVLQSTPFESCSLSLSLSLSLVPSLLRKALLWQMVTCSAGQYIPSCHGIS
jgi:hypothetical protein